MGVNEDGGGVSMGQERTIYHGGKVVVEYPEIRKGRFNKYFYFGFYCTNLPEQARRWAVRYTGKGIINAYRYVPDDSLHVLVFPEMTEEWLDFIAACRSGKAHSYDIVEGPMANDTIFNYVQDFLDGRISRAALSLCGCPAQRANRRSGRYLYPSM